MKLDVVVAQLHATETRLAALLRSVAEKHQAEHEVFHVCRDLARWSEEHVAQLAEAGRGLGLTLAADVDAGASVPAPDPAQPLVATQDSSLALLADLRLLSQELQGAIVDWLLLSQGAKAGHKKDLADLAARCSAQTDRQAKWVQGYLKTAAPQALTT